MIQFFVRAVPAPGGSKNAFLHPHTKRIVVTDAGGKRTKDWRSAVAQAARLAYRNSNPLEGALRLKVVFYMPRPKSHYNRLGLRENAPVFHATKPDATKLLRSTEDACTGILWRDDATIVKQEVEKRYADDADGVGVQITLEVL